MYLTNKYKSFSCYTTLGFVALVVVAFFYVVHLKAEKVRAEGQFLVQQEMDRFTCFQQPWAEATKSHVDNVQFLYIDCKTAGIRVIPLVASYESLMTDFLDLEFQGQCPSVEDHACIKDLIQKGEAGVNAKNQKYTEE